MADVIATIWDFDKTLIPNYMQEPIFKHYKFDGAQFWAENRKEIQALRDQGLDANEDSFYLNRLLEFSKKGGMFEGLNNDLLVRFGKEIEFYEGVVDLFTAVNKLNDEPQYRDAGITFENYIVSTGLKRMIIGSDIFPHVKHVWGAELVDVEENGLRHLGKIAYSLDNTSKTKAIFEINKGVGVVEGASIDVNSKIPESERRVRFRNMVYVADGPSDVPAFSLINEKGGATLAVYPKGSKEAFAQVDKLRRDDRVQMIAEADYRKDSTAVLWIMRRLEERAQAIIEEKNRIYQQPAGTPRHL